MAKSRSTNARRGRAVRRTSARTTRTASRAATSARRTSTKNRSSSKSPRTSPAKSKKKINPKGSTPQVDRAERIIRATVKGGAGRATSVLRAIKRAGISTRTYRTARKRMRTSAVRRSFKGISKGRGQWYVSLG